MKTSGPDFASCNKERIFRYLETILEMARPPDRADGTLPSVLTSVDLKLTYDETEDQFRPFIIGDINANPEGIAVHNEKITKDLPELIASQFISNIQGSGLRIVVSLPEKVYSKNDSSWKDTDSWLTQDKRLIVQALQQLSRIERVYLTADAAGISSTEQEIEYTPPHGRPHPIDGYVNLYDLGESLGDALESDPAVYSLGANAPTAVWNPYHPWTNKIGLLRTTSEVLVGSSEVQIPRFQKVHSVDGIESFAQAIGRPVVLKGPYGTWGDEVVTIKSPEKVEQRIVEKERVVQDKRGWSSFSMLNLSTGEMEFKSRSGEIPPLSYGYVEEAITGEFERNGHQYDTVEVIYGGSHESNNCPIDFVPLITRGDDSKTSIPSIILRIAGRSKLNANSNSEFVTYASLREAFEEPVMVNTLNSRIEFNLRSTLENIADRTVEFSEIREALNLAGSVAFTARNLSAYAAEEQL